MGLQIFCSVSALLGQSVIFTGSAKGAPERGHTRTGPSTEGSKYVEQIMQQSQSRILQCQALCVLQGKGGGQFVQEIGGSSRLS